jgi:hypothetical protein
LNQVIESWEKLIKKIFYNFNDVCQQVANGIDERAHWSTSRLCGNLSSLKFVKFTAGNHDQSLAPAKSFGCKVEPNLASAGDAKLLDSTPDLYTMFVT